MTQTSLAGMPVALSIAPSADLARLGLSELHLRDAFIELCRYVLVLGGQIVYGGDLRASGLLPAILELAESHRRYDRTALINFVPYPENLELDEALERSLRWIVRFRRVPPPGDPAPAEPDRAATAACLTAMRQEVTRYLGTRGARVLMGGETSGYSGLFPGVVEEAYLALEVEQPLYLIGMFGGAARALGDLMLHGKRFAFEDRGEERDGMTTAVMLKGLERSGRQMLRDNGLSPNENERLLESGSFREVLALTLTGLQRRAEQDTAATILGKLVPRLEKAAPSLLAAVRAGERMGGWRSPAHLAFEAGVIDPKLLKLFGTLLPLVTAALGQGVLGLLQAWVLQRPDATTEALLASIRKLRDDDADVRRTLEQIAEKLRAAGQTNVTAETVERLIADAALLIVEQAESADEEQ